MLSQCTEKDQIVSARKNKKIVSMSMRNRTINFFRITELKRCPTRKMPRRVLRYALTGIRTREPVDGTAQ
jgi:hypothetical protein